MPMTNDILADFVMPDAAPAVLLIESLHDGDAAATDFLELDFGARTKSRLRTRLASGAEVGLFLPRGTILRGGQKLRARDGRYELRVTNELEETLFVDHLSLLAVDHPKGTDVFPREGLVSSPAAGLALGTVRDRRPAARVVDASGQCVGIITEADRSATTILLPEEY